MAQQYYNYMSPGMIQPATMSSQYPAYNYPSNRQMPRSYNAQHPQFYQQYQQYPYDHRYHPIMSNNGGKGKAQEKESPPSDGGSSSAQFYCFYEPCAGQGKFFKRKADLERHIAAIHTRSTTQLIDCEHPGCHRKGDYGFGRRDKMIEHMRDVHKANIPKRGQSS